MNTGVRHQLHALDAALLALLDERGRLLSTERDARAAVDDLLRRRDGPLDSADVRRIFEAIDAACANARPESAP
jgi:chorismate mutase